MMKSWSSISRFAFGAALFATVLMTYQNCSKVNFSSQAGLVQGTNKVSGAPAGGTGGTDTITSASPSPIPSPGSSPLPSPTPPSMTGTTGACVLVVDCDGEDDNDDAQGDNNNQGTQVSCDRDIENDERDEGISSPSGASFVRLVKKFDGEGGEAKVACMSRTACEEIDGKIKSGHRDLFSRTDSPNHSAMLLKGAVWEHDQDCDIDKDHDTDVDDQEVEHDMETDD